MQDVFHPRQVLARYLADAPGAPTVWLELVFFSTSLTVSREILSQKPSSTALSANNRSVQRACPAGAVEQAKAVIFARAVPSILGGLPERGRSSSAESKPFERYRRLILKMV